MSDPLNTKSVESQLLAITGKATTSEALAMITQLVKQAREPEASLTMEELRYARALGLDPRAVAEFKASKK